MANPPGSVRRLAHKPARLAEQAERRRNAVKALLFVAGLGLAALLWAAGAAGGGDARRPAAPPPAAGAAASGATRELLAGGVEAVYELPAGRAGGAKGVVFLAHGCNHGARDWFPPGAACAECVGLPEELSVVRAVLGRGYAAVALSSRDRHSKCWALHADGPRARGALEELRRRHGLAEAPLYALGASSGGSFVAGLALEMQLDAVGVMIAAPPRALLKGRADYPPALFLHMPRDTTTAHGVEAAMEELRDAGVRAAEVKAHPLRVGPRFFSDRIPDFAPLASKAVARALGDARMLDQATGELLDDPRETGWRQPLQQLERRFPGVLGGDTLVADESGVAEVLNVAWSLHELFSDATQQALDWFESGGDPGLLRLRGAERLAIQAELSAPPRDVPLVTETQKPSRYDLPPA